MSEINKIILDIEENENTELSGKGIQEKIDIKGTLTVKNPSKNNKIWNTVRNATGIETTDMGMAEEKIGEIQPEGKNAVNYGVQEKDK